MEAEKVELDSINQQENIDCIKFVSECENNYKSQIQVAINNIVKNKNIKFVLLAGPSSSGKTTTSKILTKGFEQNGMFAMPLSLDDYFVERLETPKWEDGELNYETADSIDWKLFGLCMVKLLSGNYVDLPTYNFKTGKKEFGNWTKMSANTIVIIEGLHALNPIIDKYIPKENSYKIYLSANTDIYYQGKLFIEHEKIRLFRRIIRDLYTRATTVSATLKVWQKVMMGEALYIKPFISRAEYSINSFHSYELSIYKNILSTLDKKSDIDLTDIVKKLELFNSLPKNIVPNDSVIQEFIPK